MQDQDMKAIHEALSEFSLEPKVEKEKPSNLKSEEEIRARRLELSEILDEWEENGIELEPIEAIIAEFTWILGEETKKPKIREV